MRVVQDVARTNNLPDVHLLSLLSSHPSILITRDDRCTMNYKEQSKRLGGPTALLKWYLSKTAGEISSDASQIWGERGLIAGGMGVYIE